MPPGEKKRFYLPVFHQLRNDRISIQQDANAIPEAVADGTVSILCLNPVSVEICAIRGGDRKEMLFDGDSYRGHCVYSGAGLCAWLKRYFDCTHPFRILDSICVACYNEPYTECRK